MRKVFCANISSDVVVVVVREGQGCADAVLPKGQRVHHTLLRRLGQPPDDQHRLVLLIQQLHHLQCVFVAALVHQQRVGETEPWASSTPSRRESCRAGVGLKADGGNQLDIIKTGLVKVQLGAADHERRG